MVKNPPENRLEVYVPKNKLALVAQAKEIKPDKKTFSAVILDGLELWVRLIGMPKIGDLLDRTSVLSGKSYSDTLKEALEHYYDALGGNAELMKVMKQRKKRK